MMESKINHWRQTNFLSRFGFEGKSFIAFFSPKSGLKIGFQHVTGPHVQSSLARTPETPDCKDYTKTVINDHVLPG